MTRPDSLDATTAVRHLLDAAQNGDGDALDRLMPLLYDELRELARHRLRRQERFFDTTALVHEVYLKLNGHMDVDWHGRAHFLAIASRAMRQILVDAARKRHAQKRGGNAHRVRLTAKHLRTEIPMSDLLTLDDALDRLDALNERLRKVVQYRFFGGMTESEVAAVLDVSPRTVQRDWAKARAWLYRELYADDVPG